MHKEHPGIALSVKTHQAIRSVLNHCRDTVKQQLGSGLLDEADADKLFEVHLLTYYMICVHVHVGTVYVQFSNLDYMW